MAILDRIHGILGPFADVADLLRLFGELFEKGKGAIDKLPDHVQAHIRKGDSLALFRQAVHQLSPKEADAVRKILEALRSDQAKQEHFMLTAASDGGLDNPQATVDFLKFLATMSTDEALEYLEDVDATQPSVTLTAAKGKLVQAAEAVGDAAKKVAEAAQKAEAAVSADIDNSKTRGLLDKWVTALENKTGFKP